MSAPPRYRLYSYFRSSCSYRVRIALHLKGLAFDYAPVHLLREGGEQHGAAYLATNPMREVPSLALLAADGAVAATIAQSVAIVEYLEQVHPTPPLLPADPLARAVVRQRVEAVNASIQPIQNLRVMQRLSADFGIDAEGNAAWARHWITSGFAGLEALVARSAGAYAVGDAVTLADLFLVPQVYNARRFGVAMEAFPTLARVDAALTALPAFAAAHPDAQPDAPPA